MNPVPDYSIHSSGQAPLLTLTTAPQPDCMDRDGEQADLQTASRFTPLTFKFAEFAGEQEALVAGPFCSDKSGLWFKVPVPADATKGQMITIQDPERYLSEKPQKPLVLKLSRGMETMTDEQGQQTGFMTKSRLGCCMPLYEGDIVHYKVPLPADWHVGQKISIEEPKRCLAEKPLAVNMNEKVTITTNDEGQRTVLIRGKKDPFDGGLPTYYRMPLPPDYKEGTVKVIKMWEPSRFVADTPLTFVMNTERKIWTDDMHPAGRSLPGERTVYVHTNIPNEGKQWFKVILIQSLTRNSTQAP